MDFQKLLLIGAVSMLGGGVYEASHLQVPTGMDESDCLKGDWLSAVFS